MTVTVYGEAALHVVSSVTPTAGVAVGTVNLAVGGPGAVVSLQLALLGHAPRLVGICGDDAEGAMVRSILERHGIDCRGLAAEGRTARIVAITSSDGVALAADPGASWAVYPRRDDPPRADDGIVYATGFPELVPTIQALGRRGQRLVVDVGFIPLLSRPHDLVRHVTSIAHAIDVCVVSASCLADATRDELARVCLDGGARAVLATLAADGVLVTTAHGATHLPTHRVDLVDPLCAGDAFVAGFISATCEGRDVLAAAAFGQAVAAAKVSLFAALPDRARVEKLLSGGAPA